MNFYKVGIINAANVFVRFVALFLINKILAVIAGPAGYATIGQYQNFLQILNAVCTGGINTGVTKLTAEYSSDSKYTHSLWATSLRFSLVTSLFLCLVIFLFKEFIAEFIFGDKSYSSLLSFLAISLVLLSLNAVLMAILNGKSDYWSYSASGILSSILGILLVILIAKDTDVHGALFAITVFQAVGVVPTLLIVIRKKWFKLQYFFERYDRVIARSLFSYSLMAIVGAVCGPLSYILVRNHIVNMNGFVDAGYWESVTRFCTSYMTVFTSALSVYYLPRFSKVTTYFEIKKEIYGAYKNILPLVMVAVFVLAIFRSEFLVLLFTEDFLPAKDYLLLFLIGDIFKIGAWVLSYALLSKAMVKQFVALEVIFSLSFVLINFLLINLYGLYGAGFAYSINYLIYWVALGFVLKKDYAS